MATPQGSACPFGLVLPAKLWGPLRGNPVRSSRALVPGPSPGSFGAGGCSCSGRRVVCMCVTRTRMLHLASQASGVSRVTVFKALSRPQRGHPGHCLLWLCGFPSALPPVPHPRRSAHRPPARGSRRGAGEQASAERNSPRPDSTPVPELWARPRPLTGRGPCPHALTQLGLLPHFCVFAGRAVEGLLLLPALGR